MGYEVLSNDVYESSGNSKPKKKKLPVSHDDDTLESSPKSSNNIYIHIAIIIIILLGIFFYFSDQISLGSNSKEKLSSLSLIGEVENFTYNLNTNEVTIYSADFKLEADENTFNGKSTDFTISNFSGTITLFNGTSIILEGTAQKLAYDKNVFQLKGKKFKLTSNKKTIIPIYFENTKLDFISGRIGLDESLNYQFTNSTIVLNKYNASVVYDGTFSFIGHSSEFELIAPNQHIDLKYKE